MKLSIRHVTTYAYDPPAALAIRLKLWPARFGGQSVDSWKVSMNGAETKPDFTNGWGDAVATRFLRKPVEAVEIVAEGVVRTEDRAGVVADMRCALRPGVCLRVTPRTRPDSAILALAAEADAAGGAPLARAHALSDLVHDRIAFQTGATDHAGTASAALAGGAGVCQDHAHVVISAARALGWPARYVAGYLFTGSGDVETDESAELATHAWAEVWVDGLGWVGFDAANGLCPTDAFVRLCSGLDAADAAPLRGHAEGAPEERLSAEVAVTRLSDQSQSQSQS
jgi:transglutaminase-like putative cysteine protease